THNAGQGRIELHPHAKTTLGVHAHTPDSGRWLPLSNDFPQPAYGILFALIRSLAEPDALAVGNRPAVPAILAPKGAQRLAVVVPPWVPFPRPPEAGLEVGARGQYRFEVFGFGVSADELRHDSLLSGGNLSNPITGLSGLLLVSGGYRVIRVIGYHVLPADALHFALLRKLVEHLLDVVRFVPQQFGEFRGRLRLARLLHRSENVK